MAIVKRKRRDGNVGYQVRVQDSIGRWLPSKSFARKVDAEQYERQLLEEAQRGCISVNLVSRKKPFQLYWQEWSSRRQGNISPGWRISQDQMARDYLLPVVGQVRIESFSARHVSDVLLNMDRLKRSLGTKRLVYSLLHCVLHEAANAGLITLDPEIRKLKPRVAKTVRPFLKPEEAWRLLETTGDSFVGPAVWLAALAGLRCEAIQGLRWRHVDFDNEQILICETYKRKIGDFDKPKGKDAEYVPMAKALTEYLGRYSKGKRPDDFVCTGKNGGMLDHHVFIDNLTHLCIKAKVPRVTPHGLRHTCTELYVNRGASLEDLRRLLNHKDINTTGTYVHRTPERLKALAQSIDAPFKVSENRPFLLRIVP